MQQASTIGYAMARPTDKPKAFKGDRLAWAREQKKMSQEELGLLLEISVSQVWRYENGKNEPLPAQLVKIATVLDVTTDWLLGLSDNPESSFRKKPDLPTKHKLLIAKYESGELEKLAWDILQEDLERQASTPKRPASNGAE